MSFTPANAEFEFEFSPPQSPVIKPTQHPTEESPATPKRKRDNNDENIEDRDSPSKRSSPLQQVATPETLDLTSESEEGHFDGSVNGKTQPLTPMKRSVSSSQKATPVTLVKGVNRVQLDSHSSPSGDGLADLFERESDTSLPPVKPRFIDFTSTSKPKESSKAGTSTEIPVVDLDSDSTGDEINHDSAMNYGTTEKQTATSHTPSTPASQRLPADPISRPTNPTPAAAAAPQSPLSALHKISATHPSTSPSTSLPTLPSSSATQSNSASSRPSGSAGPKTST